MVPSLEFGFGVSMADSLGGSLWEADLLRFSITGSRRGPWVGARHPGAVPFRRLDGWSAPRRGATGTLTLGGVILAVASLYRCLFKISIHFITAQFGSKERFSQGAEMSSLREKSQFMGMCGLQT